jgi:hypothetical protein
MSISRGLRGLAVAAVVMPFAAALAQSPTLPDGENGRYSFSQATDGSFLRLDTRTGNVSNCSKRDTVGWACYAVPDERNALDAEIGRLQAENDRLKDELKKRDLAEAGSKTDAQLPKADLERKGDSAGKTNTNKADADKGNRIELPLPDDRDIDRMIAFLERAWRRLIEAAKDMQRDVAGKT